MSDTTTLQPSSVESIPLQLITGRIGISDGNEDVQAEVSTSACQQASSESQDEAQSASDPASAQPDSGSGEPQPTDSTSAVEKWQRRLNAYQVLIGVLAFVGFLAMVYPQVVDHYINKDSLKLSEWTAWITFRDECRALLNDGKDIGDDCKDVLHQPLLKPPIPLDGNVPHHNGNITKNIRTASHTTYMLKRSTILLLSGSFVRRPAWLVAIFLLPLFLGFWYRKLYRSSQQQSIRRVELYRTWVTDEVARLEPYKSIGYASGQDTVTWCKTLRKRITVQEYTYTEIQHNENQKIISFDQIPEAITHLDLTDASPPPLSLVKAWVNMIQNALEDENTEAEDEGPWLPVVDKFEDENTEAEDEGPWLAVPGGDDNTEAENEARWLRIANNFGESEGCMIARSYIHTVKLLLDKLQALGYQNFALDCTGLPENLNTCLEAAAHRTAFVCDYSGYSSSPSGHENMSTFCSKPPIHFLDHLEDNKGYWLMKLPEFSFKTATLCLEEATGTWTKEDTEITGSWQHWQADGLTRGLTDSQDAPCLYVMSVGPRHVRLLFENMTRQQYHIIKNGLRNERQGRREDYFHSYMPAWDVGLRLSLVRKVFLAVGGGSHDACAQRCTECECGLISEGYYMYELDYSTRYWVLSWDCLTCYLDEKQVEK